MSAVDCAVAPLVGVSTSVIVTVTEEVPSRISGNFVQIDVWVLRRLQLPSYFPLERGNLLSERSDVLRSGFHPMGIDVWIFLVVLKRTDRGYDLDVDLRHVDRSQNGSHPCSMPRLSSCHARMLTTFAAGAVANCAQASINCCRFSKRVVRR